MSALEDRTSAALHDVVDGLDVTDDDVSRMESELSAALQSPRGVSGVRALASQRRRWGIVAATAAVSASVVAVLSVSGDDGESRRPARDVSPPSALFPPELVGLWRNVPGSPWVWEISDDGRIGWTASSSGYLAGETVSGRLTHRDGDLYTIAAPDDPCPGTLRIRTTGAATADVTSMGDACSDEEPSEPPLLLGRVSPGPVEPQALVSTFTKYPERRISAVGALSGTWFHPDSSTLLVVGPPEEGALAPYVIDDDGDAATDPDQRGLAGVDETGALVVRPFATDEVSCSPRFRAMRTDNVTLTTTGVAGGCFPVDSVQTWVRLN